MVASRGRIFCCGKQVRRDCAPDDSAPAVLSSGVRVIHCCSTDTHCRRPASSNLFALIFLAKVNPEQLSGRSFCRWHAPDAQAKTQNLICTQLWCRWNAYSFCEADGEHGTGDHLIAHTASPMFSKWERRNTGHPRDPYPEDVAITIGCSMLYKEWVLLSFSPLHLTGKARNPLLQYASSWRACLFQLVAHNNIKLVFARVLRTRGTQLGSDMNSLILQQPLEQNSIDMTGKEPG